MFDHKAFATEGLFPGLVTPQTIANRGIFLEVISRVVRQTINAFTDAYDKIGAFLTQKELTAFTSDSTNITASTTTNKISATQEESILMASVRAKSMSASTETKRGKVSSATRKTIKIQ